MKNTVTGAVVCAIVITIYSLFQLHDLSAKHVEQDASDFQGIDKQLAYTDAPTNVAAQHTTGIRAMDTIQHAIGNVIHKTSHSSGKHMDKCHVYEHTELWGDVVVWGTTFKVSSIGECCDACVENKPASDDDPECNVFVWCGDKSLCGEQYQQCWLKHLAHPQATKPVRTGPMVGWTSGTVGVDMNYDPGKQREGVKVDHEARRFHIITSAQGAAVHWQTRIHYYWYKKQKAACEKAGGCEMGGFTRLLHSGAPDDLMHEIPTVVVDPLPQDMVEHSWYVVLNRPYAFVQWVKTARIPERYVLMSEPDHIFLRPLPNFMIGETPAAFPFFYIEPSKKENIKITQKFTGPVSRKQLEELAPIGNSPTYMSMSDMVKTMPVWMNTSIAIFKDQEANTAWGWVQEMYGFTIAAWLAGVKKFDLYLNMMAQPPWDMNMDMSPGKPYYILHYTYGMDYKLTGEFTPGKIGQWRFDKRSWGGTPIPRNLGPPPTNMKNDLVRALINAFNEATDAIPCWDQYAAARGKVPKNCKEAPKHFLAEEAAAKQKGTI